MNDIRWPTAGSAVFDAPVGSGVRTLLADSLPTNALVVASGAKVAHTYKGRGVTPQKLVGGGVPSADTVVLDHCLPRCEGPTWRALAGMCRGKTVVFVDHSTVLASPALAAIIARNARS